MIYDTNASRILYIVSPFSMLSRYCISFYDSILLFFSIFSKIRKIPTFYFALFLFYFAFIWICRAAALYSCCNASCSSELPPRQMYFILFLPWKQLTPKQPKNKGASHLHRLPPKLPVPWFHFAFLFFSILLYFPYSFPQHTVWYNIKYFTKYIILSDIFHKVFPVKLEKGLEPSTYWLRISCATDCAIPACSCNKNYYTDFLSFLQEENE